MCIFEYDTPQGGVRAFYQVLTTTSSGGGFWESFMGTEGDHQDLRNRLRLRHLPRGQRPAVGRPRRPRHPQAEARAAQARRHRRTSVASYESAAPEIFDLPGGFNKPAHQPHLGKLLRRRARQGQAQLRRPPRLRKRSPHLLGESIRPQQPTHRIHRPNTSPYEKQTTPARPLRCPPPSPSAAAARKPKPPPTPPRPPRHLPPSSGGTARRRPA